MSREDRRAAWSAVGGGEDRLAVGLGGLGGRLGVGHPELQRFELCLQCFGELLAAVESDEQSAEVAEAMDAAVREAAEAAVIEEIPVIVDVIDADSDSADD